MAARSHGALAWTGSLLLIGTVLFAFFSWQQEKPHREQAQGKIHASGETLFAPETAAEIAGGRVHMAYYYAGGVGERNTEFPDAAGSDGEGARDLSFRNKEGDAEGNLLVAENGYVPEVWTGRSALPGRYEMKLDSALTLGGLEIDEKRQPVSNVTFLVEFRLDSRKVEHVAFNSPDKVRVTEGSGNFISPSDTREIPARPTGGEVRLSVPRIEPR